MSECYKKFRGSPELIRERLSPYVEYFRGRRNVLDLGCGRGEFLGLLRNAGIPAVGVDSDPEAVRNCEDAGYDIRRYDIFEFLESHHSFDGVMASHIIEHLDFPAAERLVGCCYRLLPPGGVMIVVTPNPENLTAITKTFWLDPTHVRPYPLELLVELLKSAGFEIAAGGGAKATRPHGFRAAVKRGIMGPLLRLFGLGQLRDHLYGAHDIFAVGKKP